MSEVGAAFPNLKKEPIRGANTHAMQKHFLDTDAQPIEDTMVRVCVITRYYWLSLVMIN